MPLITILFEQVLKFLSKSVISNFLENLQLIKSILNATGPYYKVFSVTKRVPCIIIGIRMVQICDKTNCKPLHFIFSSCIESGIFPTEWKMANVVPIHKQDDKQNVKNYQPVSFLPIFGKIFERRIYNEMY